jgi:hypothetical protein
MLFCKRAPSVRYGRASQQNIEPLLQAAAEKVANSFQLHLVSARAQPVLLLVRSVSALTAHS